ncbi:hypothetical protein ATM97_03055 [Nocardia sp. MH4]|nr:hypothetical protein [Nocardia sp. MH4]MBW0270098.1 hypothetical protein [Nocardia sp. MH4]
MYFARAEQQVVDHLTSSADPIAAVHLGLNAIYGVVAGLVVFAAGAETLLADAHVAAAQLLAARLARRPGAGTHPRCPRRSVVARYHRRKHRIDTRCGDHGSGRHARLRTIDP